MTIQGKGGIGKSFICTLLAQYKMAHGPAPLCVDTDAINGTFHGFGALNVVKLDVLEGKEINRGKFDRLIDFIVENDRRDTIVDSGATTFVPLWHYITGNRIPQLLAGMGRELVIHTVVTGGQALEETVAGFSQLAGQFTEQVSFVVWLNPYSDPLHAKDAILNNSNEYIDLKRPGFGDCKNAAARRIVSARPLGYVAATSDIRPGFADAVFYHYYRQRLIMIKRNFFQLMDGAVVL